MENKEGILKHWKRKITPDIINDDLGLFSFSDWLWFFLQILLPVFRISCNKILPGLWWHVIKSILKILNVISWYSPGWVTVIYLISDAAVRDGNFWIYGIPKLPDTQSLQHRLSTNLKSLPCLSTSELSSRNQWQIISDFPPNSEAHPPRGEHGISNWTHPPVLCWRIVIRHVCLLSDVYLTLVLPF